MTKETLTSDKLKEILGNPNLIQWCSGTNSVFSDDIGVGITIRNDETETFSFRYEIDGTIFAVESGDMSPATNEEHIRRMYLKFRKTIVKYFWR